MSELRGYHVMVIVLGLLVSAAVLLCWITWKFRYKIVLRTAAPIPKMTFVQGLVFETYHDLEFNNGIPPSLVPGGGRRRQSGVARRGLPDIRGTVGVRGMRGIRSGNLIPRTLSEVKLSSGKVMSLTNTMELPPQQRQQQQQRTEPEYLKLVPRKRKKPFMKHLPTTPEHLGEISDNDPLTELNLQLTQLQLDLSDPVGMSGGHWDHDEMIAQEWITGDGPLHDPLNIMDDKHWDTVGKELRQAVIVKRSAEKGTASNTSEDARPKIVDISQYARSHDALIRSPGHEEVIVGDDGEMPTTTALAKERDRSDSEAWDPSEMDELLGPFC